MAYSLVYEQAWLSTTATWDDQGANSPNGADANYPDVRAAEGVDVLSGGGPDGANRLDCWSGYHGAFQGYDASGVWLNIPTYALRATGINIARGAAEIWYKPNATSFSENGYSLLMNLHADGESSGTGRVSLDVYPSGGNWLLRRRVQQTWGTFDVDPAANLGSTASLTDQGITFRVEWNRDPALDQYFRTMVNGSVVHEENETPDGTSLHANIGKIHGATIGYAGLWGASANFRIYEWVEAPEPEITDVIPQPEACPPACGPAEGGAPGTGPDPVGTLPPWTATCTGGGTVESVADLDDGEDWAA